MLSKRDRRCALKPNSSYELGRGRRRRELAPSVSLWNRPRGGSGCCFACWCCKDPLPILEGVPGPEPVVCSFDEERSTELDNEEDGAFKELGDGTYSPDDDTARGNGIAVTNVSPPPSSSQSSWAPTMLVALFAQSPGFCLGTYIPFLFPAVTALLRVLLLRSPTRLDPEPGLPPPSVIALSGLDSRGNGNWEVSRGCGASPGVSTLCRARCVGRRPMRGEGTNGDGGEAGLRKASRSALANSSCPRTRGLSAERDMVNEDREGSFFIAIGREGEEGAYAD